MIRTNAWSVKILNEFIKALPPDYFYFVLGSTALLSYTEKVGYTRPIRDIDVIGSKDGVVEITVALKKQSYKQDTFIDQQFPFAKKLQKLAGKKYFKFEKNDKALELMISDLSFKQGSIKVELYPGLGISLPESAVQMTHFQGLEFRAVSPEALLCIYNVGLKTWGRFVKTRIEQRRRDLEALKKIVRKEKLEQLSNNAYLWIGKLKIKIPSKIITA